MISVVIPTYNEEKALPDTLRSLFAQTGDYEVIVVDGGSTDRTGAIVSGVVLGPQSSALFAFSLPRKAARPK
ncbi:MAG: glycosyltransferase [Nitrospira sp.]|nr:glycosyltransferase [Nitrospira sp.]MBH0183215.1 glycosyltransferase [Nitrospira sp.]MBH0186097.1 glycosyltransferase [Nitrospira sp.]